MSAPALTFSSGSLYLYSLDRCFALAAAHGFDGVEVLIDERYDTRQPENLQRLMDTYGLPVRSLHAPFVGHVLPGWPANPVESIRQTVHLAEAIGAAHVVIHLPDRVGYLMVIGGGRRALLPWLPASRPLRDWIASGGLNRFQAETDVCICVENLPVKSPILQRLLPGFDQRRLTWWNTLEDWPRVHPYLTLDTTHWATHGVAPLEAYRAADGCVHHIHLSNYRAGAQHLPPQAGDLDLAGFLAHLAATGFDGQIVLELNPKTLEADDPARAEALLARAATFCRAALAGGQTPQQTLP